MRIIPPAFTLFIILCFAMTGCTAEGSSSGHSGYRGTWKVSLMMGQGDLQDIKTIKIDKSTVKMTFKEGGNYGYLYKEYGPSHSVGYTYNANDRDLEGQRVASLTFDSPLYFAHYYSIGKDYVSKVFIDDSGWGDLLWRDSEETHALQLSK